MDRDQHKPNEQGGISMTTTVQKWGNSLAVRIPSSIAEQIDLCQGSEVELSVGNQSITLKPKKKKPTLEELVAQITPENKHEEVDLGREGKELF
jgi:antitoxin MazE